MVQTLKADIIINIYIKRANVNNGKIFSSGLNAIYMYIYFKLGCTVIKIKQFENNILL